MDYITTHDEELTRLRKIEGQIRGIQKMIQEKRYCIDILTQINAVVGAIERVEESVLKKHLRGCVDHSFAKGTKQDRMKKIDEIIDVLRKFRKY
ncbi:MAG: metal-sensitive transcriptional regulator [Candidatus Aminicenantales bacterium]